MTTSAPRTLETVVLAEDDPDIRAVATIALEVVGGLRVVTCNSGEEALHTIPEVQPDLVLLDVMMPGLDGPQTFAKLAEGYDLSGTPVVFLTGRVRSEEVSRYLALGAEAVLRKPFDPTRLAHEVRAIWDRYSRS